MSDTQILPPDAALAETGAAATAQHAQGLGEQESIWFKLSALHKGAAANPMMALLQLTQRYGGVIQVRMGDERVVFSPSPITSSASSSPRPTTTSNTSTA